jgi:catechol 2,3-dioxygenase-like lactoylglutathione lyase family enzyme
MEINGIAHLFLTVRDMKVSQPFYEKLLNFLGMRTVLKADEMLYCVGGRTAVGLSQAEPQWRNERFAQFRVGLHHVCFRARERADVDRAAEMVKSLGATIVHPPEDGPWAPGYYSVLFEDPDGIRLEVNHVPGKGLLADAASGG